MGIRWLFRGAIFYLLLCATLATSSALFTTDCDALRLRDSRDVAVVLSGGLRGVRNWGTEPVSRPVTGAALLQRGVVSALHLTGASGDANTATIVQEAIDAGVPESALTFEADAHSTLQNALFSRPFLPKDATLILVTDDYHVLRARAAFAWAGRPAAGCAAALPPRSATRKLERMARETAAWAINIPRAAVWSLARALGLDDHLPEQFLA
jgi:uncharacterized SAM-binding protein YcdF (DUF218 family)